MQHAEGRRHKTKTVRSSPGKNKNILARSSACNYGFDLHKGFKNRHLAEESLDQSIESLIFHLQGRPCDQHSCVNQVWIRDVEVLNRGIDLAVEVDDKLRVEELARQAEVAQSLWASDLFELLRSED